MIQVGTQANREIPQGQQNGHRNTSFSASD